MYKKYLHIFALFITVTAIAQDFRGIAEYDSKTTLEWDFQGGANTEWEAEQQKQLQKALQKKYTLKFDKTQSLYEEQEKLSEPAPAGLAVEIVLPGSGTNYKNLKEKQFTLESDIFGKEFLIVDTLINHQWKVTGETKKIGSYICYKATYTIKAESQRQQTDKPVDILGYAQEKDYVVTAWYTPDIPVSTGPANYWGLPGLILEVNDGTTVLLCSKITINPKQKIEITAPKKGQKVTQAEFDKIMGKKSQQMMEMNRN